MFLRTGGINKLFLGIFSPIAEEENPMGVWSPDAVGRKKYRALFGPLHYCNFRKPILNCEFLVYGRNGDSVHLLAMFLG